MHSLAMLVLLGANAPAAEAPNDVDPAIRRALEYLHRAQETDGAWSAAGSKSAAITALSVMAFMSAGHVPGEGKYGTSIEKGIRWVLGQQRPNGVISTQDGYLMYHHGICTLMLAEVAGMTDGKLGEEVRKKLEKAIEVVLQAQRANGEHEGGWRYMIDKTDGDISVAGWQILSLRAAKNLGCDVPPEAIDRAIGYVKRCWDPTTGAFNYYPRYRPSVACTGTGILSLEIAGKQEHRSTMVLKAGDQLLKDAPKWGGPRFFYSVYYCSQATFQIGGTHWKEYRPLLHKALLPYQAKDGSWLGVNGEDRVYGQNYGTAMSVLALTVEYRFLPIYQSGEDREEEMRK
ncbi:MAG: terpene cyclase/mutase family protein [Gemmataceae bacterium]|nr:terpene cyclase/mutase family protein [Gemmataceae bacterium]